VFGGIVVVGGFVGYHKMRREKEEVLEGRKGGGGGVAFFATFFGGCFNRCISNLAFCSLAFSSVSSFPWRTIDALNASDSLWNRGSLPMICEFKAYLYFKYLSE